MCALLAGPNALPTFGVFAHNVRLRGETKICIWVMAAHCRTPMLETQITTCTQLVLCGGVAFVCFLLRGEIEEIYFFLVGSSGYVSELYACVPRYISFSFLKRSL